MDAPARHSSPQIAAVLLRASLAIAFLYAAVGSLRNPLAWEPYLPRLLTDHFSADVLIRLFAGYEFLLAAWLASGWRVRYSGVLSALTLAGIVLFNPAALDVTFRDGALALAALALAALDR